MDNFSMSDTTRERVVEWLTDKNTSYLLGAGCSSCAGKPMIDKLTKNVLGKTSESLKEHYRKLKCISSRAPTVEDLMTNLIDYKKVLLELKEEDGFNEQIENFEIWLSEIKKHIIESVADNWASSNHHEKFFRRLHVNQEQCSRYIFTLNYDTVIESSLDFARVPYCDGFRGTNNAWFDSRVFDENESNAAFQVLKLHGSINWIRGDDDCVRRVHCPNNSDATSPVVIYPTEQKHLQTQYGIYEELFYRFRQHLRRQTANNHLVIIGYSFSDDHINEAICDAMEFTNTHLNVFAFAGLDVLNDDNKKEKLFELERRGKEQFNAFIGNESKKEGLVIGNTLDKESERELLQAEFWKFENMVSFLTGTKIEAEKGAEK